MCWARKIFCEWPEKLAEVTRNIVVHNGQKRMLNLKIGIHSQSTLGPACSCFAAFFDCFKLSCLSQCNCCTCANLWPKWSNLISPFGGFFRNWNGETNYLYLALSYQSYFSSHVETASSAHSKCSPSSLDSSDITYSCYCSIELWIRIMWPLYMTKIWLMTNSGWLPEQILSIILIKI